MRKLVLSIALAFFGFPALANDLDCTYETTTPAEPFIQVVMTHHPDLDETQRVHIASMYELAYHQHQLAIDQAVAPLDREFAERTQQIAIRMAATQPRMIVAQSLHSGR